MSNFKLQISNNKFFSNWKVESGKWKFSKGFTLIEMLVVFTLVGLLTASGLSAFLSYNKKQTFQTTVADISHTLNVLKSKALSNAKPSECGLAALEGYELSYTTGGTSYSTQVRCGGESYPISTVALPNKITFGAGTTTFFQASTGTTAQPVTITLTGNDQTATIQVETTGVISVQ